LARLLATATVLGLLAATAVAFAITESAKVALSPIAGTEVTKIFSPAAKTVAHVQFRLRSRQRLTVWIENAHGDAVRTLLPLRTLRRGVRVELVWDGLSDGGVIEPDGVYTPVVKLPHRTFFLPNPIRIDTKAPTITVPHPLYPILSPDGDDHADLFRVHYRLDERAQGILAVRGTRVELTRTQKTSGVLEWNGKLGGRPVRPGRYLLTVAARDLAGNVSKPVPFAVAAVRYVALARKRVTVRPGGRFAIRVSTDAPTVHWTLRGRSGVARRGTLHFTAPKTSGVYFLYVTVANHAARCAVVVA
jgi:hypothetical protein